MNVHHRHHYASVGGGFALALMAGDELRGVAIAGRPVARGLDDGLTLEVTRVCVLEGTPNGCSKLYARVRRVAAAMGYRRVVTYTLRDEPGTSLRAAGWHPEQETAGGSWDCPSRRRSDQAPTQRKIRWSAP